MEIVQGIYIVSHFMTQQQLFQKTLTINFRTTRREFAHIWCSRVTKLVEAKHGQVYYSCICGCCACMHVYIYAYDMHMYIHVYNRTKTSYLRIECRSKQTYNYVH